MKRLTDEERLARLKHDLDYAGHRAYSTDNVGSKSAAKAFERVDRIKAEIEKVRKRIQERKSK